MQPWLGGRLRLEGMIVQALAAASLVPARLLLVQARAALERADLRLQRARQALQHAVLRAQPLKLLPLTLRLLRAGATAPNTLTGCALRMHS